MTGQGRYGLFLYGDREPVPISGAARLRKAQEPSPTIVEALGSGVALNPADLDGYNWDFRIDSSGALATTEGLDEYAKDMAFSTARESGNLLGNLMNANDIAGLELDLQFLYITDDRTESVRAINVRKHPDLWDTIIIEAELLAQDDEFHTLIFPVPSS